MLDIYDYNKTSHRWSKISGSELFQNITYTKIVNAGTTFTPGTIATPTASFLCSNTTLKNKLGSTKYRSFYSVGNPVRVNIGNTVLDILDIDVANMSQNASADKFYQFSLVNGIVPSLFSEGEIYADRELVEDTNLSSILIMAGTYWNAALGSTYICANRTVSGSTQGGFCNDYMPININYTELGSPRRTISEVAQLAGAFVDTGMYISSGTIVCPYEVRYFRPTNIRLTASNYFSSSYISPTKTIGQCRIIYPTRDGAVETQTITSPSVTTVTSQDKFVTVDLTNNNVYRSILRSTPEAYIDYPRIMVENLAIEVAERFHQNNCYAGHLDLPTDYGIRAGDIIKVDGKNFYVMKMVIDAYGTHLDSY